MKFSDEVMTKIGTAVEILYGLDIKLSNNYIGNPNSPLDKDIETIRKSLRNALNALRSPNWISGLRHLPTKGVV